MDTLSNQLFGKDIYSITEEDLVAYFATEQEETALLEFKSGEVTLEDVYKEVAAFANTEGGILVVGAPRETEITRAKETVRVCSGSLTPSSFRSKDWLTQKLASQVIPLPVGLRVQELPLPGGRCFVVEVPQSMSPPHQVAEKGIYYIRLDRAARPAPHAFVQALFNRRRIPTLAARFDITYCSESECEATLSVSNESKIPADKVSMLVSLCNVDDIDSKPKFRREDKDGIITWFKSIPSGQVLVHPLGMTIGITFKHKQQPYFVSIGYWSIDCAFQQDWWIYDPSKKAMVANGNLETVDESRERHLIATRMLNRPSSILA